jgi:surface antigen
MQEAAMKRCIGVILVLMGLVGTAPSYALVGYRGLKDTPVSEFNEEDLSLFEKAHKEALKNRADGDTVSWKNPDTGASGTITPLKTDRIGGRDCRLLRIVNSAGGRTGDSRFWYCKQPDGKWKITSPEKSGRQ